MNLNFSYQGFFEPGSYDAKDGRDEGYRDQNVAEEYEVYGENGNEEAVYDRYEYDYDTESTDGRRPKRSCCKRLRSCFSDMGRLILVAV